MDSHINYGIKDIPSIDVTLLDLRQKEWIFDKGARLNRDYMRVNKTTGEETLAVRFVYSYIKEEGLIVSFTVSINYYDTEGNIAIVKIIDKEITGQRLEGFNKTIRMNQITYLRSAGKELKKDAESISDPVKKSEMVAAANLVDALWIRYKNEILEYENTANSNLAQRISSETEEPYNTILETIDPEFGYKIREILLNQIT